MSTKTEFNPIATVLGTGYSSYRFYEEGAVAQTFAPGNTVVVNDAGRLQEFVATDDAIMGVPIIVGTGTEDSIIPCWLFDKDTIWEVTPDTADDANTVVKIVALIGLASVDITVTSGEHQLNSNASTDDLFVIVGGDPANDKFHVQAGFNCQWIDHTQDGWDLQAAVT